MCKHLGGALGPQSLNPGCDVLGYGAEGCLGWLSHTLSSSLFSTTHASPRALAHATPSNPITSLIISLSTFRPMAPPLAAALPVRELYLPPPSLLFLFSLFCSLSFFF